MLTILLRAMQSTDGNFILPLNIKTEDDKPTYTDVSNVLTEVLALGGEILASSFTYDDSLGVKSNVFLSFIAVPVTKQNLEKIQTWTFKHIKLD